MEEATTTKKTKRKIRDNPYRRKVKITDAQIAEALEACGGVYSESARWLYRTYGVEITRQSISNRVAANPDLEAARREAIEIVTDKAETNTIELIEKKDRWALSFWLKTRGKSRGFSERTEVTGADGAPILTTPTDLVVRFVTPEEEAEADG